MVQLNESIVEDAALTWFGELGYAIDQGPYMAPGEPAAERIGDVMLTGCLRELILRLNQAIPSCTLATLRNAKLLKLQSGELPTSFILSA